MKGLHAGSAALLLLLGGCVVHVPDPAPYRACPAVPATAAEQGPPVFFATNRLVDCRDHSASPRLTFAPYRGRGWSIGQAGAGPSAIRLFREAETVQFDPLAPARPAEAAGWTDAVARAIAATPADRKTRLVVYIHGFNNSFDDVITRAHRLSEIAGGAPVVAIDWTSGSKAQAYAQDLGNAAWSLDDVEALLRLLGGLSDRITIVAHSMGSQVALNALARIDRPLAANERWLAAIDRRPDLTVQQRREFHAEADADARTAAAFQGIVLASPDFDRGQAIGPQGAIDRALSPGQGLKRGMVVYTSASDAAIRAADHAYGYARLGTTRCRGDAEFARAQSAWQNGCHLNPPRDRLAVVDTGFVKPLLGTTMANRTRHTDFLDSTEVADDLAHVLQDGAPGGRRVRCAQTIGGTRREAWYIRPDGADAHEIARKACPTDSLPAPRNR